jgi:uncharacterized protein
MRKVGTIKEIWRYPVKGMAGEQLQAGMLRDTGLAGDRIWALRDTVRKEIQSCKFRPELLLCSAHLRETAGVDNHAQVAVIFPDGSLLGSDDNAIHARLSELTGHASTLEALRPAGDLDFYRRHNLDGHTWLDELKATFERENDEPLPDFSQLPQSAIDFVVAAPGAFFLVTPFHLLTTASLAHLQQLAPASDWDARRFRPNIVIETNPGDEGLLEQAWIGQQLVFGDARIDCVGATPRCGAITRAQRDFAADRKILRTVVKDAAQNVGVYGMIAAGGGLKVGDDVYLQQ